MPVNGNGEPSLAGKSRHRSVPRPCSPKDPFSVDPRLTPHVGFVRSKGPSHASHGPHAAVVLDLCLVGVGMSLMYQVGIRTAFPVVRYIGSRGPFRPDQMSHNLTEALRPRTIFVSER